jgi:alkyl hydroperoxide reductase subunit AhpF
MCDRTLAWMAIFRPEEEVRVRELLDALERPVELVVALGPEAMPLHGAREIDFSAETVRIVEELSALSEKLTHRFEDEAERYPAIFVRPEGQEVGVRYFGLPWGYELGSLIGAVREAGRAESSLTPESLEQLAALDRDIAIDVFVTPT